MKVSFLFLRREVLVDIQQPASIKKDTSEWRTPQCIYSLRKWKKKKKENRSQELLWLYRVLFTTNHSRGSHPGRVGEDNEKIIERSSLQALLNLSNSWISYTCAW